MSSSTLLYPPAPNHVDPRIIDPSPQFRREAVKVLGSILFFIFIYFVLVILAIILALLCGYGGIMMIITFPKFITLALGTGLAGVGIMVLYFLFKFIFASHKVDRSNLIEISEKDHPLLFQFIRKVAAETQTPMPKHVYLSPDVNACVFYDSGFWSMFLPIRKNLQIGLGLVNSVNLSEFKAVIAHEFGHFSQRSMKLGSYVYNVNKVIYNMLYDNDGYRNSLQTWADLSNYFTIFAQITSGIVSGIQAVLKLQYARINKGYMALSRQMEFHADSVAASVSGSTPLITALRRFEVSDSCYNRVLNHYNSWYNDYNRKALNIYQDHTTVMLHFGATYGIPIDHGTIQVTGDVFAGLPECRIIIKDQWASHPSTAEREIHLNHLNVTSEPMTEPAWCLFDNVEVLQHQVTSNLYKTLDFKNDPVLVEPAQFTKLFHEENEKYTFDLAYKGYYDDRALKAFVLEPASGEPINANGLEDVLTQEMVKLPLRIRGMQKEIELLKIISLKTSEIEQFEFNNEKFTKKQATSVLEKVHQESDQANSDLLQADRSLFLLYHKFAGNEASEAYSKLFAVSQSVDEKTSELESILREVDQLYHPPVSLDKASAICKNMSRKEVVIKKQMQAVLNDPDYQPLLTAGDKETLEKFISTDWVYYTEPNLDSEAINLFVHAMNTFWAVLSKSTFELKKQTLARQLQVIKSNGGKTN